MHTSAISDFAVQGGTTAEILRLSADTHFGSLTDSHARLVTKVPQLAPDIADTWVSTRSSVMVRAAAGKLGFSSIASS